MALWDLCLASLMPRLSAETAFEKCSDLCERDSFSNFKASDWRAGACWILPKDSGWRAPSSLSLCLAKAGGKHLYHFFFYFFYFIIFSFSENAIFASHPVPHSRVPVSPRVELPHTSGILSFAAAARGESLDHLTWKAGGKRVLAFLGSIGL